MIETGNLMAIGLMALATYATRTLGYFALGNRALGGRAKSVLDAAPACVLISVIAPAFVKPSLPDLIALAITLVAAIRLPMLATVAVAIGSSALLRTIL